jgi:hypothetical protein
MARLQHDHMLYVVVIGLSLIVFLMDHKQDFNILDVTVDENIRIL